jgi:hypothetical protein
MDARVWRLPGPSAYINELGNELRRGRHTAAVLPRQLCSDAGFSDAVATAVIDELRANHVDARRVYCGNETQSLLDSCCDALIWADESRPATVPDLLLHPEVAGLVALLVASDFTPAQRSNLPALLKRLEAESRAHTDPTSRLTVAVVVEHLDLPTFTGGTVDEAGFASLWWWGRIARWDVAAHIVGASTAQNHFDILGETRLETIVEVARWDLDLAELLAQEWSGEPGELTGHLSRMPVEPPLPYDVATGEEPRPPAPLIDAWDNRLLDYWHGAPCVQAGLLVTDKPSLDRVIWSAQARVLLPWVEQQRARLQQTALKVLGRCRFDEVLVRHLGVEPSSDSVLEIGALDKAIRIGIGKAHPEVTEASRRLRACRNALAHLRPLSLAEQTAAVAACRTLGWSS